MWTADAERRVLFVAVALASITVSSPTPSLSQSDPSLTSFVAQYRALREEGISLWRSARTADLTQDRLIALQSDILNYQKRLASFSRGVMEQELQRQRDALKRNRDPGTGYSYLVVARTADAMYNFLGFASDYLLTRQPVYLTVALKYEEAWRALDEAVRE